MHNNIKSFKNVIEKLRLIDPEVQAQTIMALILIYFKENQPNGYSVTDLAEDLSISQASASRNWMVWSRLTRARKPGPDFVVAIECPTNRARKRLQLTDKGREYLETVFA
jgi:DNA-binding MarR family transcriptional regulator